ncbi:hypothetical protein IWQ60_010991 [Tieghemiomyces parasiticus]|uniref:RGS domain-containing protein n=1 Tax=Tieghemiomyces parasiticus TaxID=78921 RepID=A0A9W7ZJN2_9FUNG|nr:hypothetical protein IWQ60_010991 [Tieghemiomyces parasiticus]
MSLIRNLGDKQRKSPRASVDKPLPSVPRRIRLEDILCGCTQGVVSLPNFRRFLLTREHSVENLNFYEWYIVYCARWSTLSRDLQDLSPALDYYTTSQELPHFALAEQEMVPFNPRPPSLEHALGKDGRRNNSSASLVHDSFDIDRTRPTKVGITVQARIYLGELSNDRLSMARPPFLVALETALTPDVDGDPADSDSEYSISPRSSNVSSRKSSAAERSKSPLAHLKALAEKPSYSDTDLPARGTSMSSTTSGPRRQPFRREIDHCVGRFFSAYSPDELNIPQQIREQVVRESKYTTHPAIFEAAFREILKMLSRSVQDHFLKYAEQQYFSD